MTTSRIQIKLVEQMNQTFSAIVSNNLNNIMKILTSLTIILTIPTIVGSIYGMNIKLPIAERDDAFIWLVLLTLFICIVTTYYLKKGSFYKKALLWKWQKDCTLESTN
jgi:magnesium transporter